MKIGKKQTGFRFLEVREERRKRKKKKMAGERQRAATGAGHASTIGWRNATPAMHRHVSPASRAEPQRELNRPDQTRPGRPTATTWKRARVQPAIGAFPRASLHTPSVHGMANLARLFSVCPIFVSVPVLILFLRE